MVGIVSVRGRSWIAELARALATAAVYFVLARLTLGPTALQSELGRIVWPASGAALGALLLWGLRMWPGVALGAFLATWSSDAPFVHTAATALGNALEAVSATYLLTRLSSFDARLERVRDVVALVFCAAVASVVSASFGTSGLYLGGVVSPMVLHSIWWKWSLGHAMGMLVVTPFVLTARFWLRAARSSKVTLEVGGFLLALAAVGRLAFWPPEADLRNYSLAYLPFPLLVWAAFRAGLPGAAGANLVTSSMAVWATATGSGPFNTGSSSTDFLLTWCFVNVSAVTTLLLAAVVTEARRAEIERIRSEAKYRMLVEQAADGIVLVGESGQCAEVNSHACHMLGLDRESLLGRTLPELVCAEHRAGVESLVDELEPGHVVTASWCMQRSDGTTFPAEVSAKRLDDGRLQAFVRDVTERKALEHQLHQSQKMEAVGLLAGGIAHDFNNLLTAIIGHTDFARSRLPSGHVARADVEEIAKAAGRASDLTRKLLAFARKQIVEPRVVLFDELVFNLETMLRRVLGEKIELVTISSGDPWAVKVDPVQIEQVILNVAINARDAMPDGGRLVLECATVQWRGGQGLDIDMPPGSYATLTASDNGVGMDAETLSRVFEPFYTTKDRSQGTGLGLAVSYGIVKQAGGYIWASSQSRRGSTFRIFLPRAEEPLSPRDVRVHEASAAAHEALEGAETILLIEDEPLVRELAVEVLNQKRYHVLTASDGEEAIEIAERHPNEIHLTVTDVVLPAMSGRDVAAQLKASRPGLKVLFMSGYAEEEIVHHGIVDEDVAFIAKPFTPSAFTEKIRTVLDERELRPPSRG